jgi:hypothetical protein
MNRKEEPFKIIDFKGRLINIKLIFERSGFTCQKDGLVNVRQNQKPVRP